MMKEQQARMFPENTHGMQESVITSIILTSEFLIFSNDVSIFVWNSILVILIRNQNRIRKMFNFYLSFYFYEQLGHLVFFSLEFWTNVVTFRHTMGIRNIFSDTDGTKIAFVDDHNQGFIYCPVNNNLECIFI